ncbi:hypothetical protein [Sporosarcina sp. A2]|uniref:hypothetical protein n=1 Tax=Sporosarcina sp. A2 TaxID=3393449 RepID=UPI003D797F4E
MNEQMKPYRKWMTLGVLKLLVASISPNYALAHEFTDVSPTYRESVDYLTGKNYTNGISPTLFAQLSQ